MKTDGDWWTAVLSAGITAGYATTVVQLSPGPGYVFLALRRKLIVKAENLPNSLPTWPRLTWAVSTNSPIAAGVSARGCRSRYGLWQPR